MNSQDYYWRNNANFFYTCTNCGTVYTGYVRSVNCCTWVAPYQDRRATETLDLLANALQSGIQLKDTL